MYKIYVIENIDGLKYIGKTKTSLKQRLSSHMCPSSINSNTSSKLVVCKPHKISLIENCENKEQSSIREKYWIQNTKCVNILWKGDKKKYDTEWNKNNKEYYKHHHQANKVKRYQQKVNIRAYQKSWGGELRTTENCLLKISLDIFN